MLKNLCTYYPRTAFRKFATIALTKERYPNTKRGNFAILKDEHVQYFEKLLGQRQVLTSDDEVQPFNIDWVQTVRGYSKIVLKPKTVEEISEILKYCNDSNLAVCPQGGNTGMVGGSVPVFDEVVLSTLALNKIINFNEFTGVLSCESGCVLESLMTFLDERGFIMPLDLGAKGSCHIGGNISTNAGGLRLVRYGSLHGTVLGLEAVLANGDIVDCMNTLRKNNTGYHLKHLFIGSEGTLGVVTKVAILCPPTPKSINLCFLGLNNYESLLSTYKIARSYLAEILSSCEMMDYASVNVTETNLGMNCPLDKFPFYMMIETSGSNSEHDEQKMNDFLQAVMDKQFVTDGFMTSEPSKMKILWDMREQITNGLMKDGYFFKYDISLPLEKFYEIVTILRERLNKFDDVVNICGFGHFGDGNLHLNVTTKEYSEEVAKCIEPFVYQWTSQQRGSISAEHGIGFSKTKYLKYSKSPNEITLMKNIKTTMDPKGILNPYKVIYDHKG